MVEFSNTSPDPESVVIVFSDSGLAIPSVFCSVRLVSFSFFTVPLWREFKGGDMLNSSNPALEDSIRDSIWGFFITLSYYCLGLIYILGHFEDVFSVSFLLFDCWCDAVLILDMLSINEIASLVLLTLDDICFRIVSKVPRVVSSGEEQYC